MSDPKGLLTARELAAMLAPYGDLPVKLHVKWDGEVMLSPCMLRRGHVYVTQQHGVNTDYGDIDVLRLSVDWEDDA